MSQFSSRENSHNEGMETVYFAGMPMVKFGFNELHQREAIVGQPTGEITDDQQKTDANCAIPLN